MALLLLFLASLTSAEFLTPVLDHGDAALPDLCQEDTEMSCDLVQIDIAALHTGTLRFLGTTLNFLDQPGENTFTFSSEDLDEATFTVDNELGAVWGHVELADGRDFIIEPNLETCKGCHVVIEENEEAFPEDHAVLPPEDAEARSNSEWTRRASELFERGKTDKTTVVTYTIKMYYTPEAKMASPDIRTMAEEAIATTNQGYINSEIPLRAKLHCLEETEEPEAFFTRTDMSVSLDPFRMYKGGGNSLRGSADAAVLIVKDSKWCGVGYIPTSFSSYNNLIVSLTMLSCAVGTSTLGHEISHNMGNSHDKYEGPPSNDPYSQGYHIPGTEYRTIMAYPRSQKPNNHIAINFYSNPRVKVHNVPTGSAKEADAARRITEVRFVIAANGDESQECTTTTTTATATTTTTTTATTTTTTTAATTIATTTPPLGEGVISSPNFPGNYPNHFTHTDTIEVDDGQVIRLEFQAFDVEGHRLVFGGWSCRYDSLTITETKPDGKKRTLMKKHCGNTLPPVIVSTTNKVNIEFDTDGSGTKTGWSVKWTAMTTTATTTTTTATTTTTTTTPPLGEGVISSPNFPGKYPNHFTHTDTIEVDDGQVIRLEFQAFDVEAAWNGRCRYDTLTITETKPDGKKLRTILCGDTLPPVIVSTTNKVNIMFDTDGSGRKTGWSVKWTAMTAP